MEQEKEGTTSGANYVPERKKAEFRKKGQKLAIDGKRATSSSVTEEKIGFQFKYTKCRVNNANESTATISKTTRRNWICQKLEQK